MSNTSAIGLYYSYVDSTETPEKTIFKQRLKKQSQLSAIIKMVVPWLTFPYNCVRSVKWAKSSTEQTGLLHFTSGPRTQKIQYGHPVEVQLAVFCKNQVFDLKYPLKHRNRHFWVFWKICQNEAN